MVIFEAWANDARTSYIGIEQAGDTKSTVRRAIPYPYFNNNTSFLPWRYNKIVDGHPLDRVNDVNRDGFGDLVGVAANGELFGYHNASLVSGDRSRSPRRRGGTRAATGPVSAPLPRVT